MIFTYVYPLNLKDLLEKFSTIDICKHLQSKFITSSRSLNTILNSYGKAINELKSIKKAKNDTNSQFSIFISVPTYDDIGLPTKTKEDSIPDVCFLNNYYVDVGNRKPWGGEDFPEGYYNINDDKYNKFFCISSDWSELLEKEIVIHNSVEDITDLDLLAFLIWEMTFYGFSRKEIKKFDDELKKSLKESIEEMKKEKNG